MRINNGVSTVERAGAIETRNFNISANGAAKIASILSDTLYEDKIAAVIREPACNAYDEHVRRGIEETPIKIHLPNKMELYYSVRDFGEGLSDKDMMILYTSYGESLKDMSDELTGGFGIGSKVGFAYTQAFTVTSIHKHVKRVYSCVMDSGTDIPTITKQYKGNTDEPSGLDVHIPVQLGDIDAFKERAAKILSYFKVKPTVVGCRDFTFQERDIILEGGSWRILRGGGSKIVMGNVCYPINKHSIPNLTDERSRVLETSVEIDCKIGELSVAASREALSYKPATVAALEKRLDEVYTDLPTMFEDKFKACKSKWEVQCLLNDSLCKDFSHRLSIWLKETATWNGQRVGNTVYFDMRTISDKNFLRVARITSSELFRKNLRLIKLEELKVNPSNKYIVYYDDVGLGAAGRIHEKYRNQSYIKILLISPRYASDLKNVTEADLKTILTLLGNPKYELVSSLPAPANTSNGKRTVPLKRLNNRGYWEDETVNFDTGGLYVDLRRGWPTRCKLGTAALGRAIQAGELLGLLPQGSVLYGIPGTYEKKFAKYRNKHPGKWKHLEEELTNQLNNNLSKLKGILNLTHLASESSDRIDDNLQKFVATFVKHNITNSVINDLHKIFTVDGSDAQKSEQLKWLLTRLQIEYKKNDSNNTGKTYVDLKNAFFTKYPLLRRVFRDHFRGYDDTDLHREATQYVNLLTIKQK